MRYQREFSKFEVNGSPYAELAVKLAEFLIEVSSSHTIDFSQAHDSLHFRPSTMRALWTKDTTTMFQENVYDDSPSFSRLQRLAPKTKTYTLHDTLSAAWKTIHNSSESSTPSGAWFPTAT